VSHGELIVEAASRGSQEEDSDACAKQFSNDWKRAAAVGGASDGDRLHDFASDLYCGTAGNHYTLVNLGRYGLNFCKYHNRSQGNPYASFIPS
jgi:hypothetical protein